MRVNTYIVPNFTKRVVFLIHESSIRLSFGKLLRNWLKIEITRFCVSMHPFMVICNLCRSHSSISYAVYPLASRGIFFFVIRSSHFFETGAYLNAVIGFVNSAILSKYNVFVSSLIISTRQAIQIPFSQ